MTAAAITRPAHQAHQSGRIHVSLRFVIPWFAFVLALALVGRAGLGEVDPSRCAMDGLEIREVHQVDLVDAERSIASFCCVNCALRWPEPPASSWWRVRDEVTGTPMDAAEASFVLSRAAGGSQGRSTRGQLHVFRSGHDALQHVADFQGRIVPSPLRRE